MQLIQELVNTHQNMMRWRHDIHKHPEPGAQVQRTASKVAELLREFGFDHVIENLEQKSVIGILENGSSHTIALAAGLDGQMVQEVNDSIEHASTISGYMHAVGNDGITAMLLGAAKYLAATRRFHGRIVFLFFSYHGLGVSTSAMIENGLFQQFPIEEIYGLYSYPAFSVGKIAVTSGPVMAAVSELLIKITGHRGHSAFPNKAKNPIVVASALIGSLDDLVVNAVAPGDPLVLEITSFQSGDSFSYIPEEAILKGSVLYLNPKLERWLPVHLDLLINRFAGAYEVKSSISYRRLCPPTVNARKLIHFCNNVAINFLGEKYVEVSPVATMLGNDIAFLFQERPGAMIFIGNGGGPYLMSPHYDFNDAALPIGASLYAKIAESRLLK